MITSIDLLQSANKITQIFKKLFLGW